VYYLYNRSVATLGAGRAGMLLYLQSLFVAILAYFILDERLHGYDRIGAAFIIAGVAASALGGQPGHPPRCLLQRPAKRPRTCGSDDWGASAPDGGAGRTVRPDYFLRAVRFGRCSGRQIASVDRSGDCRLSLERTNDVLNIRQSL
jgi:hypothetical protein